MRDFAEFSNPVVGRSSVMARLRSLRSKRYRKKLLYGGPLFLTLIAVTLLFPHTRSPFDAYLSQFVVREVVFSGRAMPSSMARKFSKELEGKNLFSLDLGLMKSEAESSLFIKSATIVRKFSGSILVETQAFEPIFILSEGGKFAMIDKSLEQRSLTKTLVATEPELGDVPWVEGQGALEYGKELVPLVYRSPHLRRVGTYHRVGNRRWDLIVDRKIRLMLPQDLRSFTFEDAISKLDEMKKRGVIKHEATFSIVDLRIEGKSFVRNALVQEDAPVARPTMKKPSLSQ